MRVSLLILNRAETEVSCLLIKREVFEKIEGKYPGDLARMKVLAHNRYRSFLNVKTDPGTIT